MNQPSTRKKRRIFTALAVILTLTLCSGIAGGVYLYSAWRRAQPIYRYLKEGGRGWRGRVHQADPVLGFAPIPGSAGAHTFPIGPDIPMRYDEFGFRVPVAYSGRRPGRPLLLSLGCSFTYGDAAAAEETFTWQAGEILGWDSVNAGVCSYGLIEMLLRARELIPKFKPRAVIVQWSSWLLKRSQNPFAPSYYGYLPSPYFYRNGEVLRIRKPVFRTAIFDLPFEDFRGTEKSAADFRKFYFRAALPLFLHDDWNLALYELKKFLGLIPEPGAEPWDILKTVYMEISELAGKNGGKAYILNLPWTADRTPPPRKFAELGLPVIDAQLPLLQALPPGKKHRAFRNSYQHYRGDSPQRVDKHPNARAHRLIAEEIARVLAADFPPQD